MNRCPGALSLRNPASLIPISGSSARSSTIRSGCSCRMERISVSPKAENGAAISIAGAVQASCARNTSLTISRNDRSEEISAVRMVRSVIGISPSVSLNQLQRLHQRAAGRATVAALRRAHKDRLDVVGVARRILQEHQLEVAELGPGIRLLVGVVALDVDRIDERHQDHPRA